MLSAQFVIGLLFICYIFLARYNVKPFFNLVDGFLKARKFSNNQNLERELYRINLLRILTGLIILHRTFYILVYEVYLESSSINLVLLAIVILSAIGIIFGLMTPVFLTTLLLIHDQIFDAFLRTSTLGSDVLQMVLIILVFFPAGTRLSLDEKLMASQWKARKLLRSIYRFFGKPTVEKASILRFASFLSYSMLCLYSALMHTRDAGWTSGLINIYVLTSSYLGKHFELFRSLMESYTGLFISLSIVSGMVMFVWQFLQFPFVFINKYTKGFVIIWGVLFFSISTFFLQLGWLTYYEFTLWALVFWQGWMLNTNDNETILVLYDDRCNLCYRTIRFLGFVDLFSIVEPAPLSRNIELAKRNRIDPGEAYKNLYGISKSENKVYEGFDLYALFFRRMLLLCPFYPIMLASRLTGIGPLIYRYIAARRIRLFGVCNIESISKPKETIESDKAIQYKKDQNLFKAFSLSYCILLILFISNLPYIKNSLPEALVLPYRYYWPAEVYGLSPINVFNDTDIRLSEKYFTLSRIQEDGTKILLPFTGQDGRRLKWHESDRMYFGNSLGWRRTKLRRNSKCFEPKIDMPFIRELIKFDQNKNNPGSLKYGIDFYYEPIPDLTLLKKGIYKQESPVKVCSINIIPNPKRGSI